MNKNELIRQLSNNNRQSEEVIIGVPIYNDDGSRCHEIYEIKEVYDMKPKGWDAVICISTYIPEKEE